MTKLFLTFSTILFLICFIFPAAASAKDPSALASAALAIDAEAKERIDYRARALRDYLSRFDSPLAEYADDFIKSADAHTIDWKLLPAIAGVESTFGKALPYNSHNAWGWGIYGDNAIYFSSYPEAIETISKGLRENYIDKGAENVYQIGRIYAASPTWAERVEYFMNKISVLQHSSPEYSLSISL